MIVGIPKEIKNNENRVGIVPAGVKELVKNEHEVIIQKNAGVGSGISNEEYEAAGAKIIESVEEVWSQAEMIMKVKEPMPQEFDFIKSDHIIFTYFHFASEEKLTEEMIKRGSTCVAYETVYDGKGLPLLRPMSEVAGKMASLMGGYYLSIPRGGRGILITGVTGVKPAKVVVIGGGTVGRSAAKVAASMGADVVILQRKGKTFDYLEKVLDKEHPEHFDFSLVESTEENILKELKQTDIAVGAVLLIGAKAPKLVTREMIKQMKPGSVIVDVAIDQGGMFETSRPTSHSDPVYVEENVLHYCVTNMPGAFARTSTFALTAATLPYAVKLANGGIEGIKSDSALLSGLNIFKGKITNKGVAEAFKMEYIDPMKLLP